MNEPGQQAGQAPGQFPGQLPGQVPGQLPGQVSTPLVDILARGPVSVGALARWGAQLARELAGAHEVGRVHGNVRAGAVSVGLDGVARLSGYGEPQPGPVAHPAPELAHGGMPTSAADIFALGALLYEAGGGGEPRLMPLWVAMGHADPAQRPTASRVAERLGSLDERRPRPRRKALVITGVAVVALLAALGGTWLVARHYLPWLGQSHSLADPRTTDPCSLVDAKAMQKFGATRVYPDLDVPAACNLQIWPETGDVGWLQVVLTEPYTDDHDLKTAQSQQIGTLTVYQANPPSTVSCKRIIELPDRFRVGLLVSGSTTTRLDPCEAVDAAVQDAVRLLNAPNRPRRNLAGPPNSLIWVDACTLGDAAALQRVPGLNVGLRERQEGGWYCEWGNDPVLADPPSVDIYVSGRRPLTGQTQTIGGRAATVTPAQTGCTVMLAQRPFQGVFDEPRTEVLVVQVYAKTTSSDALCTSATAIAEAAATKLPPPG
jgi:eukaryotic-like serine/threonine-protein kinase